MRSVSSTLLSASAIALATAGSASNKLKPLSVTTYFFPFSKPRDSRLLSKYP